MEKQTISVVVSAYNEERVLARCLASVRFADEIILVDNNSTDATVAVARKYKANVYKQPNQLMLNINKNYGFSKAKSNWILNLDADEEVPKELVREILSTVRTNPTENGFWMKRKNLLFKKWITHGLWWPDKQLRLFRRNKGKFPCVHIHEYIEVEGQSGELNEPYIHHNYESVHQYLVKIDRTSSSEALSLKEMNHQFVWYDAIRFPLSDFLKIYFAQAGYKDGLHGLVLALFQAFYSFATFAKFWEMHDFPEHDITPTAVSSELTRGGAEARYWMLTMKINESKGFFGKVKAKVERKLMKNNV